MRGTTMNNRTRRISDLSPEQRRVLEDNLLRASAAAAGRRAIPRRGISGPCPLSFAQRRLWFLEQLEGQLVAYNMPMAWRLQGLLSAEALRRALAAIVRRHESLRTTFELEGDMPIQVVRPPPSFELPVYDLRTLAADRRDAQASRLRRRKANGPLILPRMRCSVHRSCGCKTMCMCC